MFNQKSFIIIYYFYGHCPKGIGCHNVKIFEASDWSKEEMLYRQGGHLGVDEHDEDNLKSAAAGKQHK